MINVKHILEGIVNTIQAKESVEAIASERYAICKECKFNSSNAENYKSLLPFEHCTICKCNLQFKTHSLHAQCPISKWLPVSTKQENDIIQQKLKSDEQQSV